MGTSLIPSHKPLNGIQRVWQLPKSWKAGSSVTSPDGGTITPPGGVANGDLTGYDTNDYPNTLKAHGSLVTPVSLPSKWHLFDTDMERAANSAGELLDPLSVDMSTVVVVALGPATRVIFAAKSQATVHTTSPVIRPWLFWGDWNQAERRFLSLEGMMRADAATAAAAGTTLTLPAVASNATMADSWLVGNPIPDRVGYDTLGATHMIVMRETAGVVTGGGNLLQGVCLLLN